MSWMHKPTAKENKELALKLLAASGEICYICRLHLSADDFNKDHVFPESQGYTLNGNMMPTHLHCNSEKENRIPTIQEIEFACNTYDKIGMTFDPTYKRGYWKLKKLSKPLDAYIHELRAA